MMMSWRGWRFALVVLFVTGCKLGAGTLQLDEADTVGADTSPADVLAADVSDDVDSDASADDVPDTVDVETEVIACGDCTDTDPCTIDQCDELTGECVHPPAVDLPCDDGTLCTSDDRCDAEGQCKGAAIECDDEDVCTVDACDPLTGCTATLAIDTECDDADACTEDDRCGATGCAGVPIDCDDDAICTTDSCDGATGFCVNAVSVGLPCDDGSACTPVSACTLGGVCAGTIVCDDDDPCTADACQGGTCVTTPIADGVTPCDDADACTGDDRCGATGCAGVPSDCDDEELCTTDLCDGGTGLCVNGPNVGLPCDDGSACTPSSACTAAGVCAGTVVCDDGDPCTVDSCQGGTCATTPITDGVTPCDDADACTANDRCGPTGCAGAARNCDDEELCTTDSCDGGTGLCVNAPNVAAPCDDGSACTPSSACTAAGVCAGTVLCDDGDPCTVDSCQGGTCATTPITDGVTPCDDADACTENDRCGAGGCAGQTVTCDDGKLCTVDACLAATGGCSNVSQVGLVCDDGDQCTPKSTCNAAGICDGPIVCDDGNACTADSCNNGLCVFTPAPGACSDGNPCTTEQCVGGACTSTALCGDRSLGHAQVGRPGVARVGTDGLAIVAPASASSVDVRTHFMRSAGPNLGQAIFTHALTPAGTPGAGGAAVGPIRSGGAELGFWIAHSRSVSGGTADGSPDIILDGYSTSGPAGLVAQTVNATVIGPQTEPTGVTLPNGGIAIGWTAAGTTQPAATRVLGRFVSQTTGTGITGEFALSPGGYVASAPHMAVGSTGPFAVAMVARTIVAGGNGDDIMVGWTAGTATAAGPTVLGVPVVVCGGSCAGTQSRPQIAASRDGSSALVVWESSDGGTTVHGRLLGNDPNTLAVTLPSAEFLLSDSVAGARRLPAVAEWAGGFAVLWRDDAVGWVLRRLSPLGVLGPEQTISTALGVSTTVSPALIALQDGSRLVAALPGTADVLTLAGFCSPSPTLEDCADDCTSDQCMNLSCVSNPVGVDCGP